MNILWLTEFFPESEIGEITGGVESRCFFVHKHLSTFGEKVEIIGKRTNGKRWAHLSFFTIPRGIVFYLQLIKDTFVKISKYKKFDIVEGTNYTTYPLAWVVGRLIGAKVVFWYPDVFLGSWMKNIGPAGVIGELVERIVLLLPVDKYIAISETTKEKLVKAGVKKNKIEIVYCGVDEEEIEKIKSGRIKKKFDLSTVSRLVSYKRISDLISAIHMLSSKHPNISAVIVGQGPEKKSLEEMVKHLGIQSRIIFLGHIRNHLDVLETVSSSRIFCFPSEAEGFGISTIEAAALGVPSVLSNIAVLREISRDGQSGLIFEKGDPSDLAKKIELLLTDNALYQKKSQAAMNLSKQYSWGKIAKQTLAIYKELLQ